MNTECDVGLLDGVSGKTTFGIDPAVSFVAAEKFIRVLAIHEYSEIVFVARQKKHARFTFFFSTPDKSWLGL